MSPTALRTPVLLATSNGVGMGHLTRQLTVALAGAAELDVMLLSLSGALPTVARASADGRLPGAVGVRFEHCPSRTSPWQGEGAAKVAWRATWDHYFADRVRTLAAETGARVVVFDGVVPYAGLLAAREAMPTTAFVWVRRGMWQAGVGAEWLARSDAFDLVVEPGDFGAAADTGPTAGRSGTTRTAPVSLTSVVPPLPRDEARRALGLDPTRPALLLAPGSGAYADVSTLVAAVLARVAEVAPDWQVAVTRQAIARHATRASDQVVVLQDVYPLARYLPAFDAAVSAAGYNAVHEQLAVGLPTLFVPSTGHETDDQVARVRGVTEIGAALAATGADDLVAGVDRLLDAGVRAGLAAACADLPAADGASTIAALLADLGRAHPAPAWPDRVGPPAWRRAATWPRGPVRVVTTPTPPVDDEPTEQLVAGASPRYREARRRTSHWLYR
ncbi:hypothetical protein [Nocardioides alkalitolerans]|uniref:hypothetical protein n=1 Tax=Nocardioides alkalitolerans TaxID=281714 RepID=UPI000404001E|nr:hypothetical protein [Nocardioides alkalitolerans]